MITASGLSTPPNAPAIANLGTNTLTVELAAKPAEADSQSIQRSTNGSFTAGTVTTIATGLSGDAKYDDSGLTPNTTYYYRAVGVNSFGSATAYSVQTKTWDGLPSVANAPSLAKVGPTTLTVELPALPAYATSFSVQRATNCGFSTGLSTIATGLGGGGTFDDTGLTPNTLYFYRAIAGTISASWNGRSGDTGATQPFLGRGTYTFDIYVQEMVNANDENSPVLDDAWLKSEFLGMSQHSVEYIDTAHDDDDEENDEDAPVKARISYKLDDGANVDADQVKVYLLDHDFQEIATHSGGILDKHQYSDVDIHTLSDTDEEGQWRGIFTAVDSHASLCRDHHNRRMLAINQVVPRRYLYVMIDPGHGRVFQGALADGSPDYEHNRSGTWIGMPANPPDEDWKKQHEGDTNLALGRALGRRLKTGLNNTNTYRVNFTRQSVMEIDPDYNGDAIRLRRERTVDWFDSIQNYYTNHRINMTPHVVMIAIHTNADDDRTTHGTETYYQGGQQNSAKSQALANAIHNRLKYRDNDPRKVGAGRHDHEVRDAVGDYYILRGEGGSLDRIPRVITEVLFHTNTEPWATGATPELSLLTNGVTWTEGTVEEQGRDSAVTYTDSWWGFTRGMRALRFGLNDYFAENKEPP